MRARSHEGVARARLTHDSRHRNAEKSFTPFSENHPVRSYTHARALFIPACVDFDNSPAGGTTGKKERRRRRCGEQISVALAYHPRGKGIDSSYLLPRIGNGHWTRYRRVGEEGVPQVLPRAMRGPDISVFTPKNLENLLALRRRSRRKWGISVRSPCDSIYEEPLGAL